MFRWRGEGVVAYPTCARIVAVEYSACPTTHDTQASRTDFDDEPPVGSVSAKNETDAAIRTPDQRLRVFVSSTLGELAAERAAVARAISALGLTPVMFELGARPHPPRELYRAYLAQSDILCSPPIWRTPPRPAACGPTAPTSW
jgi:Domain of unknown function (DUF4062)